jgi:acetoacetyl-CoA reductase
MAKVAVVTGGPGNLGTAICKALIKQGRTVIGTYHPADHKRAIEWQKIHQEQGLESEVYPLDIIDYEACELFVEQVETDVGPVEILINNAGVTRDAVLKKMEKADWDVVIKTNLGGVFNLTRQVFPKMLHRRWGRIVNISSMNAQKGQYGQSNFAASKAGIHGFTMSVAAEGARHGVTVNSIAPGYVETEAIKTMPEDVRNQIIATIPVGRLGKPEDIARAVAFLTADDAGYITGVNFPINGGSYFS